MRRTWALMGVVLLALAGCSAGSSDNGAEAIDGGGANEAAVDMDASGTGADRQVITTAWASVLAENPRDAADDVVVLAEAAGGRVERRNVQAPTQEWAGYASLTLRLPADELDALILSLSDVGEVLEVSQNEQDVTLTAVDLDARIDALEVSIERLLGIMAESADTADLLAAEAAVAERQAELESLQAERNALADQVALSTLTVEITGEAVAEVDAGGFWGGITSGWLALTRTLSTLLTIVGWLVPWLILIVPVTAGIVVLRRRAQAKAAAKPAAQPATFPAAPAVAMSHLAPADPQAPPAAPPSARPPQE